ncbi:unnamed protein product [Lathyrus oleraceus]
MSKFFKYIYVILLYYFVFIVAREFEALVYECDDDDDCPQKLLPEYFVMRCVNYKCVLVDSEEYPFKMKTF